MRYIIRSSEKASSSASEMETKALLHLLCEDGGNGNIIGFAIDFFNDVTGMDRNALRLYDVQSKGTDSGPSALGEELVTLYKNYISEFKRFFVAQILFVRSVTRPVLGDQVLTEFRYCDMTEAAQIKLRSSFVQMCRDKTYIDNDFLDDEVIDAFLDQVLFVVAKPDKEDYIRPLIKTNNALGTTDRDLRAIFAEIRKKQLGIKTSSKVEGLELKSPFEAYNSGRILRRSDIELLVISRVLNRNPLKAGVPKPFESIYNGFEEDYAEEMLEGCQNDLAKQMFTTPEASAFWKLLNDIVTAIKNDPDKGVEEIYRELPLSTLDSCRQMDALSHQYFISIVKEGLKIDKD